MVLRAFGGAAARRRLRPFAGIVREIAPGTPIAAAAKTRRPQRDANHAGLIPPPN
ncbi:hypothetical protein BTH_I2437 [Burkholderia thailandensis E264]|uniref:Uncharacterized protein n=1 Tax=Burkholderia thailandensis (strain ATCC 700388 / DSM 13276 / CCUG 48851 / CIP 106301 / E264) TaxID=271848 RepID=Q2SVU1_BURTA|nr:hypothetical protein BTH_I2437 [Burkholderia thailandensis E264]